MKILEEEPMLADECKLPWLVDAFLYPVTASAMIHIAVFVFLPRLVSLLVAISASFLSPRISGWGISYIFFYLTVPFYVVFYAYVFYYIAYCITDGAKGSRRASDIPIPETFDAGDFVSQAIILLGCVAICFWPTAVYYVVTERTDLWFWLLSTYGVFFLPMAFLRGVVFDSFDALNPMSIIRSVCNTFLSYCGLVLLFVVLGGFVAVVLPLLPVWGFLLAAVRFYLVFVLAHRLGWFYWWHKDRLSWGL